MPRNNDLQIKKLPKTFKRRDTVKRKIREKSDMQFFVKARQKGNTLEFV